MHSVELRLLYKCAVLTASMFSMTVWSNAQTAAPTPPLTFVLPAPTPNDTLKSPEVQSDGHVIFRLYAPKANEVILMAEGAESTPGATMEDWLRAVTGVPMTKGDDGVWSVSYGSIEPGVYRYTFAVDGVASTDPRNPAVSESLTQAKSMYEVPGASFLEYKQNVPHGAIASVMYPSSVTGELRRMHIYTPPGYEAGGKRYPVLYLLHGGGDTDDSWSTVGRAGAILDNLIFSHKAEPMIVVMPAGHISRDFQLSTGLETMGHDQFNQDLTDVVVPYVDTNYRTVGNRQHRALAGLSMGGMQTLTISLTHSSMFASIGIFSSGWFPEARDKEEKTDLAQYKREGKPFNLYWVDAGKLDIAYANSNATVVLLKKYGITPEVHESEGFHAWNNWRDYLALFAPRLFHIKDATAAH